jgi:hypothetical protein
MAEIEVDRERVIQTLCAHYAHDHLTTQELEVRFDRAYRATSVLELQGLVLGLPALAPTELSLAPVRRPAPAPVQPGWTAPPGFEKRRLVVMSEFKSKGAWRPPQRTVVKCIMGSVLFDLRDAVLEHQEIEFDISAVMGEVKFILPPWVRVEADGTAFMGSFDHHLDSSADPNAPIIRISGSTVMGSVVVKTRLPGESALEAWRRSLRSGN